MVGHCGTAARLLNCVQEAASIILGVLNMNRHTALYWIGIQCIQHFTFP
jgi:hypothetical protein